MATQIQEIVNAFATGRSAFLAAHAFERRVMFSTLTGRAMTPEEMASLCGSQSDVLRQVLHRLVEANLVDACGPDRFAISRHACTVAQLPDDLDALAEFARRSEPLKLESSALCRWISRCNATWSGPGRAIADVLDGAVLAPLLAELHDVDIELLENPDASCEASPAAWCAVHSLFIRRRWGRRNGGAFHLTSAGRRLLPVCGSLRWQLSYEAAFGDLGEQLLTDIGSTVPRQ